MTAITESKLRDFILVGVLGALLEATGEDGSSVLSPDELDRLNALVAGMDVADEAQQAASVSAVKSMLRETVDRLLADDPEPDVGPVAE